MNLSLLFFLYWLVCAIIEFVIEYTELKREDLTIRNYCGYVIFMSLIGFLLIPIRLLNKRPE